MKILEDGYQKGLLIRLSKGDREAFYAIYQSYSKPMYLRMMNMVRDADVVEDLLQDLFIKLWIKRETLDTEKSFQSYMYTVAQNLVYNYFRKISNEQALIKSLIVTGADHWLNGSELLENKQAREMLQMAINQLTSQRKQVFNLVKIDGKTYEEAGEIMGISRATVNTHMTKATQSIKEYLLKNQDLAFLVMSIYAAANRVI